MKYLQQMFCTVFVVSDLQNFSFVFATARFALHADQPLLALQILIETKKKTISFVN